MAFQLQQTSNVSINIIGMTEMRSCKGTIRGYLSPNTSNIRYISVKDRAAIHIKTFFFILGDRGTVRVQLGIYFIWELRGAHKK